MLVRVPLAQAAVVAVNYYVLYSSMVLCSAYANYGVLWILQFYGFKYAEKNLPQDWQ